MLAADASPPDWTPYSLGYWRWTPARPDVGLLRAVGLAPVPLRDVGLRRRARLVLDARRRPTRPPGSTGTTRRTGSGWCPIGWYYGYYDTYYRSRARLRGASAGGSRLPAPSRARRGRADRPARLELRAGRRASAVAARSGARHRRAGTACPSGQARSASIATAPLPLRTRQRARAASIQEAIRRIPAPRARRAASRERRPHGRSSAATASLDAGRRGGASPRRVRPGPAIRAHDAAPPRPLTPRRARRRLAPPRTRARHGGDRRLARGTPHARGRRLALPVVPPSRVERRAEPRRDRTTRAGAPRAPPRDRAASGERRPRRLGATTPRRARSRVPPRGSRARATPAPRRRPSAPRPAPARRRRPRRRPRRALGPAPAPRGAAPAPRGGRPQAPDGPPPDASTIPGWASRSAARRLLRALFVLYAARGRGVPDARAVEPLLDAARRRRVPRERTRPFLASPYFRSFLLGLGLLHLWAAASEIEAWRREPPGRRASRRPAGARVSDRVSAEDGLPPGPGVVGLGIDLCEIPRVARAPSSATARASSSGSSGPVRSAARPTRPPTPSTSRASSPRRRRR